MKNHHSTPVVGTRCDKCDLSTSSINIEDEIKRNNQSDCDMMQNSQVLTHVHLSEVDRETITIRMHELFKVDLDEMVTSIVPAFIPQVIKGIIASLNEKIESLVQENNVLKDQVAKLTLQADRAEQYSRSNCLRVTGIPETKDNEDTDEIILDMAIEIGANLSIEEIDRSHR
ncbi:hypothetical protein DPMN_045543 [Dreissena polymorpha]|uniref:Uncharacterized protein n=1 Tax=Dreissena polymorpha TaxID=45954 RepID=A0A9D4D588_DREPO|nr:hypothetical protein DPMN_045543 [Dreissena polymorpha]